jgi:hypothetical protein
VKTIKALKQSIKLWNSDSMGNIDGKIKTLELESESFRVIKKAESYHQKNWQEADWVLMNLELCTECRNRFRIRNQE